MRKLLTILLVLLVGSVSLALAEQVAGPAGSPMPEASAEPAVVVEEESPATETFSGEDELFGEGDEEDFTDGDIESFDINDPIEPFNRGMFWVNDKLYFYLFKPIARGYRVVPEPARQSVANFFSNLGTPVRFVNSLLQLKFVDAGNELGRLVVNSTVGIGGLFDPAKKYCHMRKKDEDFGQTLGSYGVGNGFYIVWPILGPSSARDTVGMAGDFFLDPMRYVDMKTWERVALKGLDKETKLSLDKDTYEAIKRQALDPYFNVRTSYAQHRAGKIRK